MKEVKLPPLKLLNDISNRYQNIWKYTDEDVKNKDNGLDEWNDTLCYLPIGYGISILQYYYDVPMFEANIEGSVIVALASWRRDKRIYKFDEQLCNELFDESISENFKIPVHIFQQLPAQCIYIQLPDIECSEEELEDTPDGFFVWIEHDYRPEYNNLELRIEYINKLGQELSPYIVHLLPNGTIKDGIDDMLEQSFNNCTNNFINDAMRVSIQNTINESRKLICNSIQLILYVCSENADIKEDETQAKIYRMGQSIKDKYREIRKYNVGLLYAKALRQQEEMKERNIDLGHKKSTHIRQAHWHHYWIGSGDKKQLVLKWLNSMIINGLN